MARRAAPGKSENRRGYPEMRVVRPQRTCFAQALRVMACGAAALLAACSTSHPAPPGTPVVTMSNLTNSGDFISYIININDIQLTRRDGGIVLLLLNTVPDS